MQGIVLAGLIVLNVCLSSRVNDNNICEIRTEHMKIEYDLSNGKWNCYENDQAFLKNVYGTICLHDRVITTMDNNYERRCEIKDISDGIGSGKALIITHFGTSDIPILKLSITLYYGKRAFTVEAGVINNTSDDLYISEICPIETSYQSDGGLFFAEDPEKCRVLQNAFWMPQTGHSLGIIESECSIMNWWSTGICDLATDKGFIIGIISPANVEDAIIVNHSESEQADRVRKGLELNVRGGCYTDRGDRPDKTRRPLLLKKDAEFNVNKLILLLADHTLDGLEEYGDYVKSYNNINLPSQAPMGIFTAYSVDKKNKEWVTLNEENTMEMLDFLAKTLKKYGIEYVKINVGTEIAIAELPEFFDATKYKNMIDEINDRFPKGMKALVDEIHRRGFKAALQTNTFKFVKGSEPDEIEKVKRICEVIVDEWGFDYLMFDFTFFDKETLTQDRTMAQVVMDRFTTIKEAVGDKAFIEGCMMAWGPVIGMIDGYRPSDDYRAGLENLLLKGFASRYYLHNKVFYNDAEFLDLSETPFPPQTQLERSYTHEFLGSSLDTIKSSLGNSRAWASLIGLCGLSLFTGGYLPILPNERLNIYEKILPVYGKSARPLDLFEREYPQIWDLHIQKHFGSWDVLGLFNWDYHNPQKVTLEFKKCNLDTSKKYLVFDFWGGKFLGEYENSFSTELPPRSCLVVSIHEKKDIPQIIASDRHITMGAIELIDLEWNEFKNELGGTSISPTGTSHELYIHIPHKYELKNSNACKVEMLKNNILQLRLEFNSTEQIRWSIAFSCKEKNIK